MKESRRTQKIAGRNEQNLPGDKLQNAGPGQLFPEHLHRRAIQRTQELLTIQIARFREGMLDSMRVFIEPLVGIHLSIELRRCPEGLDVKAVLHGGDFQQLNRHWSTLQEQLLTRGIRLGPLASLCSKSGRKETFNTRSSSLNPAQSPVGTISDLGFGGAMTESPKGRRVRTKNRRGSETLA